MRATTATRISPPSRRGTARHGAARRGTALIADPDLRQRDERLADRDHHTNAPNPLHDESGTAKRALPVFAPNDFTYDADAHACVCPAGKSLYRKGARHVTNGYVGKHVRGAKRDCAPCAMRTPCVRTPESTVVRTVAFLRGREDAERETHTRRMQQRLNAPAGREQYGRRFATVEPVFANARYNTRLDRFTLRGRTNVNGQWLLFCLVHNIAKLTHAGYAAESRRGEAFAWAHTQPSDENAVLDPRVIMTLTSWSRPPPVSSWPPNSESRAAIGPVAHCRPAGT